MAELNTYDVAIIGAGPAGLSAAINCVIRKKEIAVFSNSEMSYRLSKAERIDNYLGMSEMSGKDMSRNFLKHAKSFGVDVKQESVTNIMSSGNSFTILTDKGMHQARSIILAIGMPTKANIPGEADLLGSGVSYCATCDGPLYKGKNIAVVGYMEDAEEEVEFLCELAGHIYYLPQYKMETKREETLNVLACDKLTYLSGSPLGIEGEGRVAKIRYGKRNTEGETADVDAVFVLRPAVPVDNLLPGLEVVNGAISVDKTMATNIDGVYAAGDCTGAPWQVAKSVGEGQVAALSVVKYLSKVGSM